MENFVYTHGLALLEATADWTTLDLRAVLLDATSTAGADRDAEFVDDIGTLGEVTGTGYARQALTSLATALSEANDALALTAAALAYAAIDVGDIAAVLIYHHETDDTDSIPLFHIGNGFTVTAAAPASIGDTTVYVDPLPARILTGSALTFTGPSIATLTATANAGARSLSVTALSDAIALAATAEAPAEGMPIPTNGGPLTIALPANLLEIAA